MASPGSSASVTLALSHSEHTVNGTWREPAVAPFPWRFRLEYTVTLGPTHLQLRLQATNLGSLLGGEEKMAFTTYLVLNVQLLDEDTMILVDGMKTKRHGIDTSLHTAPEAQDSLAIEEASIESQGYVDRIYCHHDTSKGVAQLLRVGRGLDPSQPEEVSEYDLYQTAAFSNTVYMVCVEPAVAKPSKPVELAEGEIWSGECLISIK
ncbi:MAG: hypothetical protein SGPRY_006350 [Prymnesium sp.]